MCLEDDNSDAYAALRIGGDTKWNCERHWESAWGKKKILSACLGGANKWGNGKYTTGK